MSTDLAIAIIWSALGIASAGVTLHLYRNLGALVASQATIMAAAALADVLAFKAGVPAVASLGIGALVGVVLGLAHVPVLYRTGPPLLLVATAILQLLVVQAWYALPDITGGSGGILYEKNLGPISAIIVLSVLLAWGFVYMLRAARPEEQFRWSMLRELGRTAESFGVNTQLQYCLSFAVYGLVLGIAGITGSRVLGFLTVDSFGLSWALACVMIALASTSGTLLPLVTLAITYSAIRVLLRQSVHGSVTSANLFELAFPLVLLVLARARGIFRGGHGWTKERAE